MDATDTPDAYAQRNERGLDKIDRRILRVLQADGRISAPGGSVVLVAPEVGGGHRPQGRAPRLGMHALPQRGGPALEHGKARQRCARQPGAPGARADVGP